MTSTDTYQLKWHSHSSHLNGSVASLLRSEKFTDVVLCTMDGSQIPAHKFILSSCSVYLCQLFEGQRSVTRMGGLLYVVLPSEISTKALKILVEYMYKGETTVSNEVLDTVLKAGEVLKIRGLWRQMDDSQTENTNAEKPPNTVNVLNKQAVSALKKQQETEVPVKIASKKDEKAIKVIAPVQGTQGQTRPMFIGPPKLVFIKTADGSGQIRPLTPKGQTIIVTPDINKGQNSDSGKSTNQSDKDSSDDVSVPRVVRKPEKKYGKRARIEKPSDQDENAKSEGNKSDDSSQKEAEKHEVKEEPEWDASSIEEEERSIAEMFQAEMTIKTEPADDVDIEEETLMYSPLTCELCAEVFTVPGSWVRHVEEHARTGTSFRRRRSSSEETEEMALLRCDLCKKHFPNPALWVRHIQSIHTDKDGVQNKTCPDCNKEFPSHASMLIHLRTHTGERPYVCGLCNKGFNVKSNLLRHLRTLHDRLSPECGTDEAETSIGGGSSNEA